MAHHEPGPQTTRRPPIQKAAKRRCSYSPITSLTSKSAARADLRRQARHGENETHTKTGVEDVL